MILFYSTCFDGDIVFLNESESIHCIRTLRKKNGDEIYITNTKGLLFKTIIVDANSKCTKAKIIESVSYQENRNYFLHLAVAPTKNPDRLEWFIEKAVEIGLDAFTPVICEHSEKKHMNIHRVERIAIAAAKQSLKTKFTSMNHETSFHDLIQAPMINNKFIATCNSITNSKHLKDLYKKGTDALILIGPEGDFSRSEIDSAIKSGFVPVNLGNNRFRTETAALMTCFTIYSINE